MSNKRHFKGNNNAADKKRRKEHAEKWATTRGGRDDRNFETPTSNKIFEAFYRAQGASNKDEEDWTSFLDALKTPLPACFRINSDYQFADELKKQLYDFLGTTITVDDKEIKAVENMSWYPCAYKIGTDRKTIRKAETLQKLHKWMIQHTDSGNITRQEAVSMVPPLALNVEPHHKCLDMCAAPGSKTSQLLEIVQRSVANNDAGQGLVVANDSDTDRAYMLVHQCRRINSPLLMITTHQGQFFPRILAPESSSSKSSNIMASDADDFSKKSGFFDRVLCDVPCSGDGTLRKNPAIWGKWRISSAVSLHPLQFSIAQRGMQLLKAGGLMVYSTCSISPYENEAVVAELLRSSNGLLELVDARQFIPGFTARPGLSSWLVLDDYKVDPVTGKPKRKADEGDVPPAVVNTAMEAAMTPLEKCLDMGMVHYTSFSEVPGNAQKKLRQSLFPPSDAEKEWMHLERCLRCVPQDEDTGGFFVATLRKKDFSATEPKAEATADTEAAASEEQQVEATTTTTDKEFNYASSGLVAFQKWDVDTFNTVKKFYGLSDEITCDFFYTRDDKSNGGRRSDKTKAENSVGSKTVYFVPPAVQQLIQADERHKLKVVASGVKIFERRSAPGAVVPEEECDYRLLQEGAVYLMPYMNGDRKVSVTAQDFSNFLGGGLVSHQTLSAGLVNSLTRLACGVVVCEYNYSSADVLPSEGSDAGASDLDCPVSSDVSCSMFAVCWRGKSKTLNVMCNKIDIASMKHQMESLRVLRPRISPRPYSDAAAIPAAIPDAVPDAGAVTDSTADSESK